MNKQLFKDYAVNEKNQNWNKLVERETPLYKRKDDIRSDFGRDYTRILHSMAYRRLKHKTQVFFNINNDHICTRMEHVSHVESVSTTIAKTLGLNVELTKAISLGHDLGHAPFGHQGERIINDLTEKYLEKSFWHEKNGLRFVSDIELLKDNYDKSQNLNLTYAVRDGIISHCGELDQNGIKPRDISIDFDSFDSPGKYEAVTWEGCVVKIADKIAYVGRDIEDALSLKFLDQSAKNELLNMAQIYDQKVMNTTVIIHNMIIDICKNSSPEKGICMSSELNKQLNEIKHFNDEYIYKHKRLAPYSEYSKLVINQIFNTLHMFYDGNATWNKLNDNRLFFPCLINSFEEWLATYCEPAIVPTGYLKEIALSCKNKKIYGRIDSESIYIQAIIDFISGMTDRFAVSLFNELLEF